MKSYVFFCRTILGCVLVLSSLALSQTASPPHLKVTPLEKLLNPDGSLKTNSGFNGSLDPSGWQMSTGENGKPIFIHSEQSIASGQVDLPWDSTFTYPGFNGEVYSVVVSGTDIYVGGNFTTAGGVSANRIAKWNGSQWSALGSGMNNGVVALAVSGTDIYAGGSFDSAGGIRTNSIAKWNGSSWSALGSGVLGSVYALAVSGTDVYVGGTLISAGGVSANHIAKWNGSSWSALGSGMNKEVRAIVASGSNVYVGGVFDTAGGVSVNHIAKWNGSGWSALGSGMNSFVLAIAVSGSDVYAGGTFFIAGGDTAYYVAKWNGSSWSALGSGMTNAVYALAVNGSDVYAGGLFITTRGNLTVNRIAKWNGSSWSALGSGLGTLGDYVYALAANGSDVYAGGSFTKAGVVNASRIAKWNGSIWSAMGNGLNGFVHALAVSGSDIYVGGSFFTAGGLTIYYVAKWNGSSWSALGNGMSNGVYALAVNGSDVYAGGPIITTNDALTVNRIAKWNGSTWSALGSGLGTVGDYVYAIAVSGSDVYAGGTFTTAGGGSANRIAKWNGSSWSALGSGMDSVVYALTVIGSDIYAGGLFTTAGGVSVNHIAKWNGSSWSALGSGTNGSVNALVVNGTDVYAGGLFTTAGGGGANRIARWNGSNWSALGSGMNNSVSALAVNGTDVYAGGLFTTAGGGGANRIARWNGSSWFALGSGTNSLVEAIAVSGSNVYVGGQFTTAGTKSSSYIAHWSIPPQRTITATAGPHGSISPPGVVDVIFGSDQRFTMTPNTGYHLDSLLVDGANNPDSTTGYTFIGIITNHTIRAVFKINTYTITATAGAHGSIDPPGVVNVDYGSSQNFTITPAPSYHVSDVVVNGNSVGAVTSYLFTNVTANNSIIVSFTINGYTVTATAGLHGTITPSGPIGVNSGSSQSFSILPDFGYHIDSVIVDGVNQGADTVYAFTNVTVNHTIRAVFKINTYTITATAGAHGSIAPSSVVNVVFGSNQSFMMTAETGYHPDSLFIDNSYNPDSSSQYTFTNVSANHTIRGTFSRNIVNVVVNENNRWNMVSVPVVASDYRKTILFSTAVTDAYAFEGGYIAKDTLTDGRGYWLKFNGAQPESLIGFSQVADSFEVVKGWNMIGSISSSVPVTNIMSSPGGIVTSSFYGYSGGYVSASSIEPGKGYWVKVNQNGKLILSSLPSVSAANRIKIVSTSEIPPPPPDGGVSSVTRGIPKEFGLQQNYPNPFNPATDIQYALPEEAFVTLKVFNIIGQEVAVLVNEAQDAGYKSVEWNAGNMPSGVYMYRLTAGRFTEVKKLLLVR